MIGPEDPQLTAAMADDAFQQAVAEQRAGRLPEAGELYRKVLRANPAHPVANHNFGALAVQMEEPAAGLPYFAAALEADPTQGQYWLSYIDALIRADHRDDARQVLTMARQHGLEGEAVDALARRLEAAKAPGVDSSGGTRSQHKPAKAGQSDPRKSARKGGSPKAKSPSQQEMDAFGALFAGRRFADAAALARTMAERFPSHWFGWKALGVVFQNTGNDADALMPMERAVALSPRDAEAHNNLGIILKNLGRLTESEASYRRALRLNPGNAQAHGNLGATLQQLNRLDEAEASYRRALRIDPKYAKAHGNLGTVLYDLERLDEAEAACRRALSLKPDWAEAHGNLGLVLRALGRLDEAEASIRRALVIDPNYAEAHSNLGTVLKDLGRLDEAEASQRRALQIEPRLARAHCRLGAILYETGRTEESRASYLRAREGRPNDFETQCGLGIALRELELLDAAETSLRQAVAIRPNNAVALGNLGLVMMDLWRLDEAEALFRRTLQLQPDAARVHSNLGGVLSYKGRLDEAAACFRRALEIEPGLAAVRSNLLYFLTQFSAVDPQALFAEHRRYGELLETPLRDQWPRFEESRDPERVLRIGFVSADLCNHALASFIEPILVSLARSPQLVLHAYSSYAIEDAVSGRLRQYFALWRSVAGLGDAALAKQVHDDRIDILIDLSGHTGKNRLLTFARKPAPVQASWMGYPGTTGLRAMDYYLADPLFLPPGKFDDQFTEKIVRLPANAPFLPSAEAPPVNPLPALSKGYMTFGSFNRLSKLSSQVVALWSQPLRALPESRMLLGGMHEGEGHDVLIDWFAREGVASSRLDFHPRSAVDRYLALHHHVDICLDTFPYNGATTTLHALWMGVPTLSLTGTTAAGRTGTAILGHVDMQDFIAHDAAEFVAKGLSWAGRLTELADIRAGLRGRMVRSAISRPALIAAGLERALRVMWRRWCAGLPAESFEVSRRELNDAGLEEG